MSTARWGRKWADVDEEDEDESPSGGAKSNTRFETQADKDGIKTIIEYVEREGKTYKVTKKVKQTTVQKWTNRGIDERKAMAKFGKALEEEMSKHVTHSVEDVNIELSQALNPTASLVQGDVDEKFYQDSLNLMEKMFKEKKVWTDINREKQEDRDKLLGAEEKKPEAGSLAELLQSNQKKDEAGGATRYIPPSLRGAGAGGEGGKGDGKGKPDQGQEASLRVFNLSEDVKEGDLQELFGQFGRLQRVYLAKHMDTFLSKGFAFVTYYNRDDGQKAINKLNGHGYDNLIMKVEWAKPRGA